MLLAGSRANAAKCQRTPPRASGDWSAVSHVRRALRAGRRPRDRLLDARAADHLRRPVVRDVLRARRERPRDVRPPARLDARESRGATSSTRRTCGCPRGNGARSRTARIGVLDPNSASDSDLWIAYDLLQAGRLWNEPALYAARRGARRADREAGSRRPAGPRADAAARPARLQKWRRDAPESELPAAAGAARARARTHPDGPWARARRQRLQAHQDHRAARLRARLGGVARTASSSSIRRTATPAATTRSASICGRGSPRPPIRSRSRGSARSAACARASRRPASRRSASPRRRGAATGEGPLSYWAALAPYFKALGDERGARPRAHPSRRARRAAARRRARPCLLRSCAGLVRHWIHRRPLSFRRSRPSRAKLEKRMLIRAKSARSRSVSRRPSPRMLRPSSSRRPRPIRSTC